MIKGPGKLDERIPIEVGGIQANFCKNPQCQNFGVPASTKRQPRGKGASERGRDTYSPYKPVMVGKLLDIFRVFYNYVEVGRNKQTPAIRLGISKGKISVEDIIYFQQQAASCFLLSPAEDFFSKEKGPLMLNQQFFFSFLQHVKRSARPCDPALQQ